MTETVKASDILNKSLSGHLVEGEDTLLYDLGNLCAFDHSSIDKNEYKENPTKYINELARKNVQLLISRLFQLPIKSIEEGSLALLPKCETKIPRERSVPQGKQKTRWEAFAELKGIKKQKKSKMQWDEKHQEYRPSYGYKKANDDSGEYIIEGKQSDKVGDDPFQKKEEEKNQKVQKQKKREQRNFDEASMRQMGNVGKSLTFSQENRPTIKSDMEKVFDVAKLSTASLGRFDKKVENEKDKTKRGNKKLAGLGADNVQKESESNQKLVDRMFKKEDVLNVDKAVRQEVKSQERENYSNKRRDFKQGGGSNKRFKK
ncbi:hypothetical protein DICPUDRAFT_35659 [Dictyostelium purpureum]|uniref:Ribosome biogenesis regulatory protein n=1 Tax=Dictyostelium purpureum TaxID=5786 RepID=F0ZPQ4_DICPU|nr:uncharacterized protein DICPUDRAFT_35659 [Dictyostelium purpureum]EGC34066.1 hypothetical protein DICPUDRAFT_35659 [Dictyostelium purpureum]|eukprot:XP_003289396.1 hypothetical protein DICPUDRAFT_35659 [Dictyostelium purpureum]